MSNGIAPTVAAIQKAWRLGRTLAMTDPTFVPQLDEAHLHPSYVQFMIDHRKKLEHVPAFWTWDLRLEDLIEDEAERHNLTFDKDAEQIEKAITTPIKCAFWFGWEGVTNLKKQYERAAGHRPISAMPAHPAAGPTNDRPQDIALLAESGGEPYSPPHLPGRIALADLPELEFADSSELPTPSACQANPA